MTAGGYLAGVVACVLFLGAVGFASVRVQGALLPAATRPVAWTARLVIAVSATTLMAEALGTFGWLSRWTLVGVSLLLAAGCLRIPAVRRAPISLAPPSCVVYVAVCVAFVVGQALLAIWRTAHTGITYGDSLQYHLTNAATFAHGHHTNRILLDSARTVTPYYPFNDELLFGVGMSLFGRDTLVLFTGFIDIAGAFLTVWSLARRYGRQVAIAATGAVTYLLLAIGPNVEPGAGNDWHATWLLLAGLLFVVEAVEDEQPRPYSAIALAGLAAGQAAGTKLNVLVPVLALFVLAIVLSRQNRRRFAAWFAGMALSGGGYWYARDAILVHNPLPELNLHLGLPRAYPPVLKSVDDTVLHYLPHLHVVRAYFVPGLHRELGLLWPLAIVAIAVGLVGAVIAADRRTRSIAVIGVVSIASYLVTPSSAAGLPGAPTIFVNNIRYALVGLLLGFVCLAALRSTSWLPLLTTLVVSVLSVSLVVRHAGWADGMRKTGYEFVAVCLVAAAIAVGWFVLQRPRWAPYAAGVAVLGVVAGFGYSFNSFYLNHRYHAASGAYVQLLSGLPGVSHDRIAILGQPNEYSFYGPTWTNTVVYAGNRAPHQRLTNFATCQQMRTALADGGFHYVVYQPWPAQPNPEGPWLRSDPHAVAMVSNAAGVVYRLGMTTATGCPTD